MVLSSSSPIAAPSAARVPSAQQLHVRRVADVRPSAFVTALALLIITGVAAVLRLWNSTRQSLRLDEGFTIRYSSPPLMPIVRPHAPVVHSLFQTVGSDVHPPAYFVLMHFWMQAFGTDLAILRLPSEIASILAIPALFLLAVSLYARSVALLAALMGALSPFWIWHGQEARMYPFLLLFTIMSTLGFIMALRHNRRWGWPLFGVFSLLAIYTQYFAFLVLFAQGLFLLAHLRQYRRGQVVTWFGVLALMAVAYIPWVLVFHANYHGASDPSLVKPTLYTPLIVFSTFLFGYLSTPITSNVIAAWPLLVVASLALGTFAASVNRRASFLWLLFLVPVVMVFVVTLWVRPLLSIRYLIVVVPALYILLAVALDRMHGKAGRLIIVLGIVAFSLGGWTVEEASASNPQGEDFRTVVQYIETHARPSDVVALDAFYNQDAFSYYSHINLPIYALPYVPGHAPRGATLSESNVASYVSPIVAGPKHLWVVYYLEANYDPNNVVRHYLAYNTAGHTVIYGSDSARNQSGRPGSFRNVQLFRYDLIPRRAAAEQVRPYTIQELRALTPISPTLRQPFLPAFGQAGERAPMIGRLFAPAQPGPRWYLSQIPGSPLNVWLTVWNPGNGAVHARIVTAGSLVRTVTVPPQANLDVQLNLPADTRPMAVTSDGNLTVMRTVQTPNSQTVENALAPPPARSGR